MKVKRTSENTMPHREYPQREVEYRFQGHFEDGGDELTSPGLAFWMDGFMYELTLEPWETYVLMGWCMSSVENHAEHIQKQMGVKKKTVAERLPKRRKRK